MNVAILVVLSVVGIRYCSGPSSAPIAGYTVGETIASIPQDVVAGVPRSLVFQLRSTCAYCADAMPFYKELVRRLRHERTPIRLVVATSESPGAIRQYLDANAISVDDVVQGDSKDPRLGLTPAVLLIDAQRRVLGSWMGVLSAAEERQVVTAVGLDTRWP